MKDTYVAVVKSGKQNVRREQVTARDLREALRKLQAENPNADIKNVQRVSRR